MSARGKIALLVLAACLPPAVSGCATNARPRFWSPGRTARAQKVRPQSDDSAAATAPNASTQKSVTAQESVAGQPTSEAGSSAAQPPQASSRRSPAAQPATPTQLAAEEGIDPLALGDVLAELDAIGALDADAKRQLLEDLRSTRPALWRPMVRQFRAALTYRQRLEAHQAAASQTAPQTASPSSSNTAVAPGQESPGKTGAPVARLASRPAAAEDAQVAEPQVPPSPAAPAAESAATAAATGIPPVPQALAAETARPTVVPPTSAAKEPLPQTVAPATSSDPSVATAGPPAAETGVRTGLRVTQAVTDVETGPPIKISLQPESALSTNTPPAAVHPPSVPRATAEIVGTPTITPSADRRVDVRVTEPVAAETVVAVSAQTSPEIPVMRAAHIVPSALGETVDWEADLQRTIKSLEGLTHGAPRDAEQARLHAMLRILYLAAERRNDALKPIEGLGPAQQDYWTSQIYSLSTLLDTERTPDPGLRASEARRHLSKASQRLGEFSTLAVQNLTFCREVKSFGVYTPFEDYKFEPGQELLLYVEIDNFKSEETEKGYHTALRSSYQILDSRGNRVGERDFGLTEEDCLRLRRDFFMRYFIYLPERIYPGKYTLQLTIEDTLSHKIGQASIELQIAEH